MKKWHWIVLAVLAYLLFLIAYTPASFVAGYVASFSANKVSLYGVSGTLFNGRSERVVAQGISINNVSWELSPLSLLLLNANVDVKGGNIRKTNNIYIKGNLSTSLLNINSVDANELTLFIPTKTLLSQLQLPVFVSASGRFRVDIEEFSFDKACEQLEGKGQWLDAAISVNNKNIDFGNFEATLSCESPAFALQIMPENKLNLDAKLLVELSGKYDVSGQYTVGSDLPKEIRDAAQFFGDPQGGGVYKIAF